MSCPTAKKYDPIRLKVPGGWVLTRVSKGDPELYIFQHKSFPNLLLKVAESALPAWAQPYSFFTKNKKNPKKEYIANIARKYGFKEVLHVKKFKTFAGVFRDSELKKLCDFYETQEKSRQNLNNLCSSEKKDLSETYAWISEKVKNIPHQWYSNYGLVIYDENFPLDSGIHDFTSYKVQKKNGKTYVDFSIPVGICKETK